MTLQMALKELAFTLNASYASIREYMQGWRFAKFIKIAKPNGRACDVVEITPEFIQAFTDFCKITKRWKLESMTQRILVPLMKQEKEHGNED